MVAGFDGTHEGYGDYILGSLVVFRSLAGLVAVVEGAWAVEVGLHLEVVLPFIPNHASLSFLMLFTMREDRKHTPVRALHDCIFNASAIILGLANSVRMSPVRWEDPVTGDGTGGRSFAILGNSHR